MNRLSIVRLLLIAAVVATPAAAFSIVIDPGHGGGGQAGGDPGALGCGLEEHAINLDISLKLRDLLVASGQTVFMTRSTNVPVALGARSDFANSQSADRFVSIHNNAFNDSVSGTETFCFATVAGRADFDQATKIQAEVIAAFGLPNRGVKDGSNLSVIRNTTMPATLSELAFIDSCAVDGAILADPARRTQGAEAHLAALAAHLGFDIGDPPPPADGELRGVVFADDGSGLAGIATAARIPGASVRIVGRNDSTTASATDASWTFTLPAGDYRVHAEAPGFLPGERDCDPLDADAVRFCSIGLLPDVGGGEGEGGEGEGEGEGEEGEGEGEEGEGEPAEGEGEEGEGEGGLTRVLIRNKPGATGGCSSTAAPTSLLALLALFGLLGARRRRHVSAAAAFLLAVAAQASAAPVEVESRPAPAGFLAERVIQTGVFASVTPSPSGEQLLISDDHYEGLTVIDVRTLQMKSLSTATRAGFRPAWVSESRLAHRVPKQPFGGQPLILLDVESGAFVGPHFEHPTLSVVQGENDVVSVGVRVDDTGKLKNPRAISPAGDGCFAPQLSSSGGALPVVVFQCLQSGLWIVRDPAGAAESFRLGAGAQPALSPDGQRLVYVVATDEGHVITAADIVVVDLTAKTPTSTVFRSVRLERAPGISNARGDGSRVLAFVVDPAGGVGPGQLVTAILR